MSLDVMKQALDALDSACHGYVTGGLPKVQQAITALRAAIEQSQEPVAWIYPEALEAFKKGNPWTAYGSSGDGRIPLYLNDAVAPKAEPRSGESGAGFESLPASSSTWWDEPVAQMRREWKGLTDEELNQIYAEPQTHAGQYARAIEAKLREKNT